MLVMDQAGEYLNDYELLFLQNSVLVDLDLKRQAAWQVEGKVSPHHCRI
jgi:hypothetical protein